MENVFAANSLVWPLCFLLIALLVLKQVRDDVRPLVNGIVSGLTKNAQSNAVSLAIALGFGLSASFSAFWEVFNSLGKEEFQHMSFHQYTALWTKVLNPFLVAVLARLTLNSGKPTTPTGTTNPPFPPSNP